jgi:predicted nucleic acid-binding protein
MSGLILLDTNILVDLFRKSPPAVAFIAELRSRPAVSAITVAELFAGVRDGRE